MSFLNGENTISSRSTIGGTTRKLFRRVELLPMSDYNARIASTAVVHMSGHSTHELDVRAGEIGPCEHGRERANGYENISRESIRVRDCEWVGVWPMFIFCEMLTLDTDAVTSSKCDENDNILIVTARQWIEWSNRSNISIEISVRKRLFCLTHAAPASSWHWNRIM